MARPGIEITQGQFVVAVENHHGDVKIDIGSSIRIRFDFVDVQYGVAQGGQSVPDFGPVIVALAHQLDFQSAVPSIIFFTER
ncbi:hypothetical protein [Candidatus Binatus sp.]|uniref:hypothetical protein n=1 Tax=Candidatus Binatus sp. TaxID=2811406 RepID=UPI003CC6D700